MATDLNRSLIISIFFSITVLSVSAQHPNNINSSDGKCTSFVLDNNGYAIFCSNFDYGKDISEGLVFVNKRNIRKSDWESDSIYPHARWTSQYGSVSFNLCMNQFSWAGMNEAGLVISTMQLDNSKTPGPDKRPWIYSNYWLQFVLDNFSTIEEVIASDSSIRITDYVDHYLISDRYGKCVTIEFIEGKRIVHYGDDLPIKALSNNTYDKSINEWKSTQSQRNYETNVLSKGSSIARFLIAADRTQKFKSTNSKKAVKIAFEILDEVSGQKTRGSPTRWSIVFDTKNLNIHFKTAVNPKVRLINLQKLDFSCKTPVKLLDINEPLEGDITHQLKSYSTDLHYKHALNAFKKWGSNFEPVDLIKQIQFIENFPCEKSSK